MIASFRYTYRNSPIDHIDSRARWIFSLLIMVSGTISWNWEIITAHFIIGLIWYILSQVTWKETRKGWIFILSMTLFMIFINTILTSGGSGGVITAAGEPHVVWEKGLDLFGKHFNVDLSVERIWFGVCQLFRMIGIAFLFMHIPFTMDPRSYGATFSGIGLGDKFAYTTELAFRFLPSLGHNFQVTLDAQKARGFELEDFKGSFFNKLKRFAPLIIPVTMSSIVGSEEIANAMDLRGFGERKRTWLYELKFHWWDYATIVFSALVLIITVVLTSTTNAGAFKVPPFFYQLFGK